MYKAFATLAIATAVSAISIDASVLAQTECKPWEKECREKLAKERAAAEAAAAEAAASATCEFIDAATDPNGRSGWECSDGSKCVNEFDDKGQSCDPCIAANGEEDPLCAGDDTGDNTGDDSLAELGETDTSFSEYNKEWDDPDNSHGRYGH